MESLSSAYDYAMYDMNQEIKTMEHQMCTSGEAQIAKSGLDWNWGGYDNHSLSSSMSDFISLNENQQQDFRIGTDSINKSLDFLASDTTKLNDMSLFLSDFETLWNFGGVSATESKNRVMNETNSTSGFISMYENQQQDLRIGTDSVDQSLDWLVSDATKVDDTSLFLSGFETLWNFNGVSESTNRVTNSVQEIKPKSLKRSIDFKLKQNENQTKLKKPRSQKHQNTKLNRDSALKHVDLEVEKRKRKKNVRISRDPQTVAARQRREKISERIKVLQRMIPGGTNMDTASVLEEAANYLRFLRAQVKAFETLSPIQIPNC